MAAPDKLTIDTPEQIALEYMLAGPGSRFLALAVDTILQSLVMATLVAALIAAGITAPGAPGTWAVWMQAAAVLAGFVLFYGYFAAFEALWHGQTPGKRLVGLRVISATGRPLSALDAILRNLLRIVDSFPGIYAVGMVAVFLTERSQRLGDLVAGTVVVHDAAVERRGAHPASVVPPSAAPIGAARLEPREIEALETFLRRRGDLPVPVRDRTAEQLARHLRERLGLPHEQALPDEALIEQLAAEYRRGGRR